MQEREKFKNNKYGPIHTMKSLLLVHPPFKKGWNILDTQIIE